MVYSSTKQAVYRSRKSPLYQTIERYLPEFERCYHPRIRQSLRTLASNHRRRGPPVSPRWRSAFWLCSHPMPRLPSRNVRRLFLPATLSLLKLPSKTNNPGCRNHRPHHLRARPTPATGLHHSQTAPNLLPVRSPPSGRPGPRGLAGHREGLSAAAETRRSNPWYGCRDPDFR